MTGKRWGLSQITNNYGSIRKRWNLRDFFSADDFMSLSAKYIISNIYRRTDKQWDCVPIKRRVALLQSQVTALKKEKNKGVSTFKVPSSGHLHRHC
jgi:hypothetical protein